MKTPQLRTFVTNLNTALAAMVAAGQLDAALKVAAFETVLSSTLSRDPLEVD